MKLTLSILAAAAGFAISAKAATLSLDLQPTGGTTAPGFQAFEATNNVLPGTQSYAEFGTSIDVDLTTANLPQGTADFRSVARNGSATDVNNDWIGVDTRTGGVDVTMTLTFSNLPAGLYSWTSTHHDGGAGASDGNLNGNADYTITDASGSNNVPNGIEISSQNDGDPVSTLSFNFTSDGSPVSFSMIMDENQGGGGNNRLFALAGSIEITQIPEPSGVLLALVGLAGLVLRRRR